MKSMLALSAARPRLCCLLLVTPALAAFTTSFSADLVNTVESRNIMLGSQPHAGFTVDKGSKAAPDAKRSDPQPEWAGDVAAAPLLKPPFETTLSKGGMVRVRPPSARLITVVGTNTGKTRGSFTLVPFKEGKYKGGGSMGTVFLDAGASRGINLGVSLRTTDELVIRVDDGTIKLKVAYVGHSQTGS